MFDINRKGEIFTSHVASVLHGGQGKVEQLTHHIEQKTEQDNSRKYSALQHTPSDFAQLRPIAYPHVLVGLKLIVTKLPEYNGLETPSQKLCFNYLPCCWEKVSLKSILRRKRLVLAHSLREDPSQRGRHGPRNERLLITFCPQAGSWE